MAPSPDSQLPQRASFRAMVTLAVPVVLIQLSGTAMQIVDTAMLGALGPEPLAASMPAGLMFFVPVAFMMGLLSSVGSFVSQALGAGRASECGSYGWQGVHLALLAALGMQALTLAAPLIFDLFGHEGVVRDYEVAYFRWLLPSAFGALAVAAFAGFFTGVHRPGILAAWAFVATLLNIVLNWLFIYGNAGFPALGIRGAALGTVIASTVQALGLLAMFVSRSYAREYGTRNLRWRQPRMRAVMKVGAPAGAQFGFDILTWGVGLMWMVGLFGTAHLAATTIVVRCMHLSFMPAFGVSAILLAMVGRFIGAGLPEEANRQVRLGLMANMGYMTAVGVLFVVFREPLLRLFTREDEIVAIGASVIVWVAAFQIFDAMNLTCLHALRGAGDTAWPAVLTVVLCLVIFVGGGLYMVRFHPELKSTGPWISTSLYVAALGPSLWLRWRYGPWRRLRLGTA